MSCLLGRQAVIAIEPQRRNLECLYTNLQINGWQNKVEVFPLGLSRKPGLANLYGASDTGASLLSGWARYPSRHKQIISLSTLDIILGERFAGKKLFIKIDVEGAEFEVIEGAQAILAMRPQPIWLVEICLDQYHPGARNPHFEQVFTMFWGKGYQAFSVGQETHLIKPEVVSAWTKAGYSDHTNNSYLFMPSNESL